MIHVFMTLAILLSVVQMAEAEECSTVMISRAHPTASEAWVAMTKTRWPGDETVQQLNPNMDFRKLLVGSKVIVPKYTCPEGVVHIDDSERVADLNSTIMRLNAEKKELEQSSNLFQIALESEKKKTAILTTRIENLEQVAENLRISQNTTGFTEIFPATGKITTNRKQAESDSKSVPLSWALVGIVGLIGMSFGIKKLKPMTYFHRREYVSASNADVSVEENTRNEEWKKKLFNTVTAITPDMSEESVKKQRQGGGSNDPLMGVNNAEMFHVVKMDNGNYILPKQKNGKLIGLNLDGSWNVSDENNVCIDNARAHIARNLKRRCITSVPSSEKRRVA